MHVRHILPPPGLADVVDSIWLAEVPQFQGIILPGTSPVACFQYGGAVTGGSGSEQRVTRSGITGMQTRTQNYVVAGMLRAVMVRFTPWGAATVLKDSLAAYYNQHFDLGDALSGSLVRGIEEQLHEAPGDAARLGIVQDFLLRQRQEADWDPLIRDAVDRLRESGGQLPIQALAREYLISERQLERRFRHAVGTSPKQFARIVRFQAAIRHAERASSWAAVAHEAGYSDQSHMIKEFQALAGLAPERLHRREPSLLGRHFNNRPGMSGFYNTVFL